MNTAEQDAILYGELFRQARNDPYTFARVTGRGMFAATRHQKWLLGELRRIAETGGRAIVSVSVRHGKSVACSQIFPAWWLGHNPEDRIILGTSEVELASSFAARARDLLTEFGPTIFGVGVDDSSRARKRWNTSKDGLMLPGGMTAVGRGGSPEGRGGSIIVDDPYRSFMDAMSPVVRKQTKEWWTSTLTPRLEPHGFAIVICARWHEDDLSGFLMREHGERWEELRLPAIADRDDDPLGRQIGEALWPERWSLERLEQARQEVTSLDGSATWSARYQQTPLALTDRMFPPDRWEWIEPDDPILESITQRVTAWDLAATSGGGDWTVGVTMGRLPDNRVVIIEVVRGRWGMDNRDGQMYATAKRHGGKCVVHVPQDPGAAGKIEVTRLSRLLAPFRMKSALPTGPKKVRAAGWSSAVQAGNVLIVRSDTARALVGIHSDFTGEQGAHDDDVDAAADAYNFLFRQSSSVSGTGASYV